VTYTAGGSELH